LDPALQAMLFGAELAKVRKKGYSKVINDPQKVKN